jgi:DNA-directed RNA polymerase subunit M/transcription elongation factor TFIIS
MKNIRCPKCEHIISFNEKKYRPGQVLVFHCPNCGKKFGIRLKAEQAEKVAQKQAQANSPEESASPEVGHLVVIENVFHYKQIIPLQMGENVIGRYMNDSRINCPIHTNDPSIDITHCVITVSRDKKGELKYVLRDGPSNTGTFVDNQILGDNERRVIEDGTLFTIGATSIILKTQAEES